jgi:hypothetical protein
MNTMMAAGTIPLPCQKSGSADCTGGKYGIQLAPNGSFNLTMLLFGPQKPILDGSCRLPAVQRVE